LIYAGFPLSRFDGFSVWALGPFKLTDLPTCVAVQLASVESIALKLFQRERSAAVGLARSEWKEGAMDSFERPEGISRHKG